MKVFGFLLLLLAPLTLQAADYRSEIEQFFELYEEGKTGAAVDRLYGTNQWVNTASDAILNIKNQLRGLDELVGDYNGRVFLGEHDIGDRFVHVTYLALYDRQPIRMEFQFYRPADEWKIYSFSFDDELDTDLEAAARRRIANPSE